MSDYRLNGLLWAIGLAASGILILLFNFDLLGADRPLVRYLLAGGMALGGLGFIAGVFGSRQNWWRLIPGWTLLALAGMLFLSTLTNARGPLISALLFLGLALAFGHVYLLRRSDHWWAIIPGGFMLVLGVTIALSDRLPLQLLGALLFAGMGLTFCLLYLLGDRRQQWWALIPGAILLVFGLFILGQDEERGSGLIRWWPLLLVVIGLVIGWRQTRRAAPEKVIINTVPAAPSASRSPVEPPKERGRLGEYSQPAPGASVELLPDGEDEKG